MKQYYLGLDCYNTDTFDEIIKSNVKGLVIGDLFCDNRMYENGNIDQILLIDKLTSSDKEIIFQCPVYVTSRNIDTVCLMLDYIKSKAVNAYVIVHDFGMINIIRRNFKEFNIIWGRMARFRDYTLNEDFIRLFKDVGVYGVEVPCIEYRKIVEQNSLVPFIVYGDMNYSTFGRQCYNKYQGLGCCRKDCLSGRFEMRDIDSNFQMTINGYIMGEKFIYKKQNIVNSTDNAEQIFYTLDIQKYYEQYNKTVE